MKGQFFIVSMVFLVGLVFVVQQLLLQYGAIRPLEPLENDDVALTNNIRDAFNATLATSGDCTEAERNLGELSEFIRDRQPMGGFFIEASHNFTCSTSGPFPSTLEVDIMASSPKIDTRTRFVFDRRF
ncbi:MAG: hypothetical protein HY367_03225 [Candidatus Aenigmarchaeota archaeon]|nr:hypothetical protein [Candidatus Aenigmarchaeota archaeon]